MADVFVYADETENLDFEGNHAEELSDGHVLRATVPATEGKANASTRAAGEMRLYNKAWFLHLKYLCTKFLDKDDHLFVVIGSSGTKKQTVAAAAAVKSVPTIPQGKRSPRPLIVGTTNCRLNLT